MHPAPFIPASALRSHKPRRNRRRGGILRRALRALVNALRNF